MQSNSLVNSPFKFQNEFQNEGLNGNGVEFNGQQLSNDGGISYDNSIMASIQEVMARNAQNSVFEQASSQIASHTLLLQNGSSQLNESTDGL